MGKSLTASDPSGAYRCAKCGNKEVHVQGNSKAPCSTCGSNHNWVLVTQTTGR